MIRGANEHEPVRLDRVNEARAKIASGFYDSPQIQNIAQRRLASELDRRIEIDRQRERDEPDDIERYGTAVECVVWCVLFALGVVLVAWGLS